MMSKILLTGATGFLGGRIAELCRREAIPVRCTGRSPLPSQVLPEYQAADLTDPKPIPSLLTDVSCIIHSAGLAHQFGSSSEQEGDFYNSNVVATENLIRAAMTAGVQKFVLVSSVAVYGHQKNRPEPNSDCYPIGPYAQSKYEAECRAIQMIKSSPMKLVILRMATIYGEGDPGNTQRLIRWIDSGRFIWIGRGNNRKSLIYIDDAAHACFQAGMLEISGSPIQIYDIADRAYLMRDIVTAIYQSLGKPAPRFYLPASLSLGGTWMATQLTLGRGLPSRVHRTVRKWLADDVYDGTPFIRDYGLSPQVSLDQGIAREVAWYREQLHSIASRL